MNKLFEHQTAIATRPAAVQSGTVVTVRPGYMTGVLLCVCATILMGIMFPVMTSALRHVDPFTFTSLRYMIAASAFLVLLRLKEGRSAFRFKGEPIALAWLAGSIGFCG